MVDRMSFVSVPFILFLLLLFTVYFSVPKKFQWIVLLVFSYWFYGLNDLGLMGYILFTTVTTFLAALWIEKRGRRAKEAIAAGAPKKETQKACKKSQRGIMLLALVLNFGILLYFKYWNTLLQIGSSLTGSSLAPVSLIMPLGISFYMFQSVGYVIDVYRGKTQADKNLFQFALFVSFFPQILQGPISRHEQLAHQLYAQHDFDYLQFKYGAIRIMWGYFKKLVISDRALIAVNQIIGNYQEYEGLELVFGMILFMLQIYTDFSGGIDITIGTAQCLGITLTENFRRPHFATSVEEYWRRWHITLGAWMKEYVFYPLAISKKFISLGRTTRKIFGNYLGKLIPTCLAMLITFLLVGIWHGSSMKYIVFGLYNGFWIILGILLGPVLKDWNEKKLHVNTGTRSWHLFKILATMLIVMVSKVFGIAPDMYSSMQIIRSMFTVFNPWVLFDGSLLSYGLDGANLMILALATAVLFFVSLKQEQGVHLRDELAKQNLAFRWIFYLGAVFCILIFGIYGIGYDAASFFYMQY